MPAPVFWTATPEWQGETVFLVAGGPSVTQAHVDRLKGYRVVVVNSSFEKAPWADLLFYADKRWWHPNAAKVRRMFKGRVITCRRFKDKEVVPPGVLAIGKSRDRFCERPNEVYLDKTVVTGALNLMMHLGVACVGMLGVDQQRDPRTKRMHHHEEYTFALGAKVFEFQSKQLRAVAEPLARAGMKVINLSPDSKVDWWPRMTLEDLLARTSKVHPATSAVAASAIVAEQQVAGTG